MSKAQKDGAKRRKFWKIALVTVAILIVAGIALERIGRAQQNKITDGTEKYSGIQLKLAKSAVDYLKMEDAISPVSSGNVYHVESVRPASPDSSNCLGYQKYSADPNNKNHYAVDVSARTYFGIKDHTTTLYGCAQLSD